ncbi:hypothetical protein N9130_01140 [bacterium]|jgi:hypothetical protein|nr:hypothetical protein [bacterium]
MRELWGISVDFLLSKNKRVRLRDIARQEYVVACSINPDFYSDKSSIKKIAIRNAKLRVKNSAEYGGLIHSLLLSLATKLVVALIQKWIDENIQASELSTSYQEGEPGYG